MQIHPVLELLKDKLIVSCQAEDDSPFNSPEGVAMFAVSAVQGGASAIRSEGIDKTARIKSVVKVPIIGLVKEFFENGDVKITRSFTDVQKFYDMGVDIIAIDGTHRIDNGLSGPAFISQCRAAFPTLCIMADIASLEDAVDCEKAGASVISTTLRGYTEDTAHESMDIPNFYFLKEVCSHITGIPVIAEGKINRPEWAQSVAKIGVWSVVVGSAITRPHIITKWYLNAIASK